MALNQADRGGGVSLVAHNTPTLSMVNCTVEGNLGIYGGGIAIRTTNNAANISFSEVRIMRNAVVCALCLDSTRTCSLRRVGRARVNTHPLVKSRWYRTSFVRLALCQYRGPACDEQNSPVISATLDCACYGRDSQSRDGGGIYSRGPSELVFHNSHISGNKAIGGGGGVFVNEHSQLKMGYCRLEVRQLDGLPTLPIAEMP
eukprot:6581911-Pyramimonas_sp.AAC.1